MILYGMKIKSERIERDYPNFLSRYKDCVFYYTQDEIDEKIRLRIDGVNYEDLYIFNTINVSEDIPLNFKSYAEIKREFPQSRYSDDVLCRKTYIKEMDYLKNHQITLRKLKYYGWRFEGYNISLDMLKLNKFQNKYLRIN